MLLSSTRNRPAKPRVRVAYRKAFLRLNDPDKTDDAVERDATRPPGDWAYGRAVSLIPFGLFLLLCAIYGGSQHLFVARDAVHGGREKEAILEQLRREMASADGINAQHAHERSSDHVLLALPLKTVIKQFNGRLTWVFFTGLGAFASLVGLLAAVLLTKAAWREGRYGPWLAAGGVLLAGAAVMALVASNPRENMPLMYDMLHETVAVHAVTGMAALPDVMNVLTAFSIGVAVSLALA